ncbi:alpha/beta hydrolase [Rhizobium tubonense]|uniref:alpha/beta hydrolase n=1 Tax=Rhizobium tubonense TaxID=484088 RepID=UPI0018A83436|nr:alpha/beta hydrolase [Rhizobium tubonense]
MASHNSLTVQTASGETIAAAIPVTFAGTVGLFTPARAPSGQAAVLFLSPWGFEEMCTRKFWRILAEDLADTGIASLRFDYAGTGDALDVTDTSRGLAIWEQTAIAAAAELKLLSGCERLILVSQGLGSAIAVNVAERLSTVDGIGFLAPTLSGRLYLRELTVWSKMIDEGMGLPDHQRETDGVSIGGLRMPEAIAADVRKLNLMAATASPAPNCLVLARPGRPGDLEFATHLKTLGARVEEVAYNGYDELVANPTIATMPIADGRQVVRWVRSLAGERSASPGKATPVGRSAEPLVGDGFRETPLRLGEGDRMFGILCEPVGLRTGATAILLTTAYDRSAGWARTSVAMARSLARNGVPSLRFDTANVADSPPRPGEPDQVLYSENQPDDVVEALDLVESRKLLPAFVVGRCSGGYLAFQGALRDVRCGGVIAVNPYVFHWDQSQSIDGALRVIPRSLETYGQKLLRLQTLRRLYEGNIDVKNAARNVLTSLLWRASRLGQPLLDIFPFLSRRHAAVIGGFQALVRRKVILSLIYSAHDIGLEHFWQHFGKNGGGLRSLPDVRLTIIPDSNHNLTTAQAREIYLNSIEEMALRIGSPGDAATRKETTGTVKSQKYADYPAP